LQQLSCGWRCCVPVLVTSSALRFSLTIRSSATAALLRRSVHEKESDHKMGL
jgi:hypothetical protein